ncbi:MAG: c-type cytochrome [Actinomycetota bacterium]|nr:c-type cytochrome [Actinomycetota bacterium]
MQAASGRHDRRVVGPLLAAVAIAFVLQGLVGRASGATTRIARGFELYSTSCASCHGPQAAGTLQGPSLRGVGPAAIDFMLSTGRMPIADPSATPVRMEPRFSSADIEAIIAYVTSLQAGGPAIPSVDVAAGKLELGNQLFQGNCAACHGAAAQGGSVGGGEVAPGLNQATATQIAEALRIGPGVMPRFGTEQITAEDANSLARYVLYLRTHGNEGGLDLGRVGPVAEGFVAWVVGLGILILVIRLTGTKT